MALTFRTREAFVRGVSPIVFDASASAPFCSRTFSMATAESWSFFSAARWSAVKLELMRDVAGTP